jgi:predicted transcriptional regulator YdeE
MFTMFNTMKIQGMYSKNLIKSIEVGDTSYYFTYNFDKDGRVTDMIVVSTASENSLTEHYKFTY